jgi:hypothetical protein
LSPIGLFAVGRLRDADNRDLSDKRMPSQHLVDIARLDVEAAAQDHVLLRPTTWRKLSWSMALVVIGLGIGTVFALVFLGGIVPHVPGPDVVVRLLRYHSA